MRKKSPKTLDVQTNHHAWLPEHLLHLKPYEPGKPVEEAQRELGLTRVVKLGSNENPYGPSPKALAAAEEAMRRVQLYPDAGSFYLRRALSEYHNVPEGHIALGAGSTELIQLLVYGLLTPKDHVVIATPTFLMYKLVLELMRIPYSEIPLQEFRYDLEAMRRAVRPETKMVIIANPNNPTGTYVGKKDFQAFLDALPENVLVVYDEAYVHYIAREDFPSGIDCYRTDPRMVVLRSFSKAYGLAGLRVGYAIARPEILRGIHIARSPFNMTCIGQAAALAALQDEAYMRETVAKTVAERERVYYALLQEGFRVTQSFTNFICMLVERDPYEIFQSLLRRGVIIRPLPPFGLPNGIRITIGRPEDNDFMLEQIVPCCGREMDTSCSRA